MVQDNQEESRYELVKQIGRGGMGAVYQGIDRVLNRRVAIKTLDHIHVRLPNATERMQEEARLLAQLNHPHIVQVHDLITIDGIPSIVMEYVPGQSLHSYLRENRVEETTLLRWMMQITEALEVAHAQHISHGDLKQENILITPDGQAKLADFGIGKINERNTGSFKKDFQLLGQMTKKLFSGVHDSTPGLIELCDRLSAQDDTMDYAGGAVSQEFRRLWHQSTQDDTASLEDSEETGVRFRFVNSWWLTALTAVFVLIAVSAWFFSDHTRHSVKVAVVKTGDPESHVINAAISHYFLQSETYHLLSDRDTSLIEGLSEGAGAIGTALGVDELLLVSSQCDANACSTKIERLTRRDDWSVKSQVNFVSPVNRSVEMYSITSDRLQQLYPENSRDLSQSIPEVALQQYLDLFELLVSRSGDSQRVIVDIEEMLARYRTFAPLYQLYAEAALEVHDERGDKTPVANALSALTNANRWIGPNPALIEASFRLAMASEDYVAAADAIAQLDQIGDYALSNKLNGYLQSAQGNHEAAAIHFARAISIRPSRSLYYHAVFNNFDAGNREAAKQLLMKSLSLYPNDHNALNTLGMIELEMGHLEQAADHIELAVSLNRHQVYLTNLGLVHLLRGDYETATRTFAELLEEGSQNPHLLLNAADSHKLNNSLEEASQLYRELISGDTGDLNVLAQAHAHLQNFDTAIKLVETKKLQGTDIADTAYSSALVYTLAEQNLIALSELERALSLGIGPVWFDLPWFESLCNEHTVEALARLLPDHHRCYQIDSTVQ